MASTAAGEALTEAHRIAQTRIAARTATRLTNSWKLLDLTDLDATARIWLENAIPIIENGARESANLAATYYAQYRKAEIGLDTQFVSLVMDVLNLEAIETSLLVTGPIDVKRQMAYRTLEAAGQAAQRRVVGAGVRHVLDAGRRTITENTAADSKALGLARVTAPDPCYFCAMLASRGPDYKDASFDQSDARFVGSGSHKVHDNCRCSLEPVFKRGAWSARSTQYAELWEEARTMGGDAAKNFRRLHENR